MTSNDNVHERPADPRVDAVEAALRDVFTSMEADGYQLVVDSADGDMLKARVVALRGACEECLVPKGVMERMILHIAPADLGLTAVALTYPADAQ